MTAFPIQFQSFIHYGGRVCLSFIQQTSLNNNCTILLLNYMGGVSRDASFNDGVLGCIFSLPKNFRQLGGIALLPIPKALIMVVEASFKFGFTTNKIITGNAT